MGQLFAIRTLSELNHLLHQQRSMTRQATSELDDIIKNVCTPENHEDEEYIASITMQREFELLERYAVLPTLTEHERNVHLRDAMQPGATFAVAAIVGNVILSHLRAMANVLPRVHRMLLMLMLSEFDKPVSEDIDLVETFVRSMKIELRESLGSISEEERHKLLTAMLRPLAEAMVLVTNQYRMIENIEGEGWAITPVGQRVMMHLFDAQRFIESIGDAHRRFQRELVRESTNA